jgi:predicted deacetylase
MNQILMMLLLIFFATYSSSVCQSELSVSPIHQQYVILKADDLIHDENNIISKNWYKFFDYVVSQKIKTSVGMVVNSLNTDDERYPALLKYLHRTGVIEFWNHGYDHRLGAKDESGNIYDEFRNSSLEFQIEQLKKSQSLVKEKLGIKFSTFGAPGNAIDSTTIKALNQFNEIKIWFYGLDGSDKLVLERTSDMEYPAGKPDYNSFIENYDSTKEYLVFQIHPNMWDENQFEEFKKIVSYLKDKNLTFILPTEYYNLKVTELIN